MSYNSYIIYTYTIGSDFVYVKVKFEDHSLDILDDY